METYYVNEVNRLYIRAREIVDRYCLAKAKDEEVKLNTPEAFKKEFFGLIDRVNLSLLEERDNFYGYFLFQMSREIRFDIGGPTAVNFRGAKYIIYFNPIMFLKLSIDQMQTTIKHEILHIVSLHLIRANEFKGTHSTAAINMAMDIVVNRYLNFLPPYATTLEWVNLKYSLQLEPYAAFEYYVEKIQKALDLLEEEDLPEKDSNNKETIETEYSVERTHELWEESNGVDEKTQQEFVERVINNAEKGEIPSYLTGLISELKNSVGELPWNLYLSRLMGTIESVKNRTITRRDRRQPERLDLRGQLRSHKAKVVVALDISASISEEEFKQAIEEVLSIVRNYDHEITLIECDDVIRQLYKVNSEKDIRERRHKGGATKFNPVFEYANHNKVNLLVYFTDGKGEDNLKVIPRGYKILWVISGRGDQLSLKEPYGTVKKLKHIEIADIELEISEVVSSGISMQQREDN